MGTAASTDGYLVARTGLASTRGATSVPSDSRTPGDGHVDAATAPRSARWTVAGSFAFPAGSVVRSRNRRWRPRCRRISRLRARKWRIRGRSPVDSALINYIVLYQIFRSGRRRTSPAASSRPSLSRRPSHERSRADRERFQAKIRKRGLLRLQPRTWNRPSRYSGSPERQIRNRSEILFNFYVS